MADFNTFNDTDSPENSNIADFADPTRKASVSANNDVGVQDGLSNGGVFGRLTLTTANTAYEAKVGVSRLTARKSLIITALDDMFWGYSNAVTTANGIPLFKNQQIVFSVDPDSTFEVWLVGSTNGRIAVIGESP